jgi:PAS domain S-box-containing protein
MMAHEILLITLGLAGLGAILWRLKTAPDEILWGRFPGLFITIYITIQGIASLLTFLGKAREVDNRLVAIILLFLPAVMSYSRQKAAQAENRPSTILWFAIGLALALYIPIVHFGAIHTGVISAGLFAIIFLLVAIVSFSGIQKLFLALSALIWVAYLLPPASPVFQGIGVFMATIIVISIIQTPQMTNSNNFSFQVRECIKALTEPCLILDLSGKVRLANDEFLALSGFAHSEIFNKDAIDLFDIPSDWRFKLAPSETLRRIRCRLVSKNGDSIPVLLGLNEVQNTKRQPCNILCLIQEERERSLLEGRIKEESSRFTSLYETSMALSSSLEIKDVLRSIARAAENLTKADTCIIFSLDHARQMLKPIFSTDEAFNIEVMSFELPIGQGLTGSVVGEGKAKIQNYDDLAKVAKHIPGTTEEPESLLSLPLIAKDLVIGALTLYKVGNRKFEEDDLKILTVFASQASAIIETSRLYMRLKASEKLYRYTVDFSGDMIFFVDPDTGKITDSNEKAQKLLKYSKTDFASMCIWELHPEKAMPIAKNLWTEAKATGWGRLGEIEYLSRDGSTTPTSVNVSMIFTGEASSIQWIAKDISEEKKAVEKSDFIQQIFERLGEGVLITDTHGRTLYANDIFCKMFRVTKSQISSGDLISLSQVCVRMAPLTEYWNKLNAKEQLIESISIGESSDYTLTKTLYVLPYLGENDNLKYHVWFFYPAAQRSDIVAEFKLH